MGTTNPAETEAETPTIPANSPNVVAFQRRRRGEPAEPFLTDAERRDLRELLGYMRTMRPQFLALTKGCPMARRLLEDEG